MRRSLPAAVVRRLLEQRNDSRIPALEGQKWVGTMKAVPRLDWAVWQRSSDEQSAGDGRLRNVPC